MDLIKLDDKQKQELELKTYENVYMLKDNDKILGFGMYNDSEVNMLYIMILEKYRSNGYGTILLQNMLSILKEKNYKELIFEIEKSNQMFINLISKFGAIHLSTKKDLVRYVLPIR